MTTGADPPADLLGVRAAGPYEPRWAGVRARINDAALAQSRGRLATAATLLDTARRETMVSDVDAGGLDLRARALTNRAGVLSDQGGHQDALALYARALDTCAEVTRRAGDRYGTAAVRAATLINRAQTLTSLGRAAEALGDLDAMPPGGDALLSFQRHNTRGHALLGLERLAEAGAEFARALDLALTREPRLAAEAYAGLAAVAARTEDRPGAEENLLLAAELRELTGDTTGQAGIDESLARLAMGAGRATEAGDRFAAARRRHERAGDAVGVARCQVGAAAVALGRARVRTADRLLAEATAALETAGEVPMLAECLLLRGYVCSVARGWADGERHFIAARELCAATGAWHQAARIDFLRADVLAASTRTALRRGERTRRREAALALALPAALAIEAFGRRFAPGPARERWAATAAAPALALSFELITKLERNRLAFELVEHVSATVSLGPATADPAATLTDRAREVLTGAVHGVPDPGPPAAAAAPHLPFAAAFTAPESLDRPDSLEPPPRLRMVPSGESALDPYLDAARHHYHLTVRTEAEVPAW